MRNCTHLVVQLDVVYGVCPSCIPLQCLRTVKDVRAATQGRCHDQVKERSEYMDDLGIQGPLLGKAKGKEGCNAVRC